MEPIVDKIFNTIYVKNSGLSVKEKTFAILLSVAPFLLVTIWLISK